MSGLELLAIPALVTGIVSALQAGNELVKDFKDFRKSKKKAKKAEAKRKKRARAKDSSSDESEVEEVLRDVGRIEKSLLKGPPALNQGCEKGLAIAKRRFAEGDEYARNKLQTIIINLQGDLIKVLMDSVKRGITPDLASIFTLSEHARIDSVSEMDGLLQRCTTKVPKPFLPARNYDDTPYFQTGRPPKRAHTERLQTIDRDPQPLRRIYTLPDETLPSEALRPEYKNLLCYTALEVYDRAIKHLGDSHLVESTVSNSYDVQKFICYGPEHCNQDWEHTVSLPNFERLDEIYSWHREWIIVPRHANFIIIPTRQFIAKSHLSSDQECYTCLFCLDVDEDDFEQPHIFQTPQALLRHLEHHSRAELNDWDLHVVKRGESGCDFNGERRKCDEHPELNAKFWESLSA